MRLHLNLACSNANVRSHLLVLQIIEALMKESFCSIGSVFRCQHCLFDFFPIGERGTRQPYSSYSFKRCKPIYHFVYARNHVIRTKFMCRNGASCIQNIQEHALNGCKKAAHLSRVTVCYLLRKCGAKFFKLAMRSIYYPRNSMRSSHQGAFVGVDHQLRGMPVLSTHHVNCYTQCRNGAYGLHPTRPIGFREFVVISHYGDVDDAKKHEKGNRKVRIFHTCKKSCLKGILT